MRRHLTYANVAATLALVFAMTGGALAAKHYLINSTSQISPKVLKKLHGAKGKTGATGKQGAQGAPGAEGKQGPTGPSNGYSAFNATVHNMEFPQNITMDTVAVAAGSYLVSAKMETVNETTKRQLVGCELVNDVNGDRGEANVTVEPIGTTSFNGRETLVVQAASTLATAGHWLLDCGGSAVSETLKGRNAEISAVQVATLSRTSS